jgi:hypothetical protein
MVRPFATSSFDFMPHNIINRAALRRALLGEAASTRHHKFTRVSPEVYALAESMMKRFILRTVHAQPSAGRTINMVPEGLG